MDEFLEKCWKKIEEQDRYYDKNGKGGDIMCLVDSSTSVDIDCEDIGIQYKCMDCETKFRGLGKKIKCPTCESTNVKKL